METYKNTVDLYNIYVIKVHIQFLPSIEEQNQNKLKMKKRTFDLIFIVISTVILIALSKYGLLEKYMVFSLIPILVAYQLGKYAERKFKDE